jgi:NADH dehydrogenase FAD-containing subunit
VRNVILTVKQTDVFLSFVVVGGGPTSSEFATELKSLLDDEIPTWYPCLRKRSKVTMIEV